MFTRLLRVILSAGLALGFTSVTLLAQQPSWIRFYTGDGAQWAQDAIETFDGGYLAVGVSGETYWPPNWAVFLIRTDSNGDTLWSKSCSTTEGASGAYAVKQTTDSGFVVAGFTVPVDPGLKFWLLRMDRNGDTLWTRTFGAQGFSREIAYDVCLTTDGGFFLVGEELLYDGLANFNVYAVRTDSLGNEIWSRRYARDGQSQDDVGFSCQQTTDGGFVVAGRTNNDAADFDLLLLKLDSNGDTMLTRTYGGPGYDEAFEVKQTSDGGFVLAGYTTYDNGQESAFLVKTDSLGDTLWTQTYFYRSRARARSVCEIPGQGYVVAGGVGYSVQEDEDIFLVRTDLSGTMLWLWVSEWSGSEFASSVYPTSDHGYILGCQAGYGPSAATCLIKFPPDSVSGVYPTDNLPTGYALYGNYPNPFNATTNIRFSLGESSDAVITIYSITGQKIRTLVARDLASGLSSVQWDGRNDEGEAVSSGVYLYQLKANGFCQTNRMVLLK